MTLWVCLDCSTGYAVGAPRCPHCGSERQAEEGSAAALGIHARGRIEEEDMPKISKHGGPSVAGEPGPEAHLEEDDAPALDEGGEEPSPGSSTETSSEKPQTKHEPSEAATRTPARKTASRSAKGRTAGSTAPSTAGGQTAPTSDSGGADA